MMDEFIYNLLFNERSSTNHQDSFSLKYLGYSEKRFSLLKIDWSCFLFEQIILKNCQSGVNEVDVDSQ